MLPHEGKFKGNRTFKMLCYVLDRRDAIIKPYFMPYSIAKQVAELQADPDWRFDEVPMPYDLNLRAKNAGTKEVQYTLIGSPRRIELTEEEQTALNDRVPIEEFQKKLLEKQGDDIRVNSGEDTTQATEDPIPVDEIPF